MTAASIIITETPMITVNGVPLGATTAQIVMGTEGRPGRDGSSGSPNFFVQPSQPTGPGPWLWIQTGLAPGGAGFTFWFEDGL